MFQTKESRVTQYILEEHRLSRGGVENTAPHLRWKNMDIDNGDGVST